MEYRIECKCCQKYVIIHGGYIGSLEDVYCYVCGYDGEYCLGCD